MYLTKYLTHYPYSQVLIKFIKTNFIMDDDQQHIDFKETYNLNPIDKFKKYGMKY